jgi:hypothetical protein
MAVPTSALSIFQGSLFTLTLTAPSGVTDVMGWGVRMQLRSGPANQSGVLSLTLTTGGGGIVQASATTWTATITATQLRTATATSTMTA